MDDWKSKLKVDPTNWLLEEENPSARYFTLTDILDKPADISEAKEAKKEIMRIGLVPKILLKMNDDGYWEKPTAF